MLLGVVWSKESRGCVVVGVQLETVGNLAIEVEPSKSLGLRRRAAELVAIKRHQRPDRRGSRREIGTILARSFRPGQSAITHVESDLLGAETARHRPAPVESPG